MKVSKTAFKNYSRCRRFAALDELATLKENTYVTDDEDLLSTLLGDLGDLEEEVDATLEAMNPYYKEVEVLAMSAIEQRFGKKPLFSKETYDQERFEIELGDFTYYCFVDGMIEGNPLSVFEVKATTSSKFETYGKNQKRESLFQMRDGILSFISLESALLCGWKEKDYEIWKNKLFDRYHSLGKYVFDLAFQRFVIDQVKDNVNYYLVVLNSEYVHDGLSYTEDLFKIIDLSLITQEYLPIIDQLRVTFEAAVDQMDVAKVPMGRYCERKGVTRCPYFSVCFKIENHSIFSYIHGHQGFTVDGVKYGPEELFNQGYEKMLDLDASCLRREVNAIQYDCVKNHVDYRHDTRIALGLAQLSEPLYFLDFETFPSPIPRFRGERVYSQSVFQFSLHIKDGKSMKHEEYLFKDETVDEREQLVLSLIQSIPNDGRGTVVVYNVSFEKSRIKELANLFPRYREELLSINERMFDLMYLFKGSKPFYESLGLKGTDASGINYYHESMDGSFSIKKLLPIFTNLSYSHLEVGNGLMAIATFAKLSGSEQRESAKMREALLAYCKQDTQSMIDLLDGIKKK